jgi:hypothetical protein
VNGRNPKDAAAKRIAGAIVKPGSNIFWSTAAENRPVAQKIKPAIFFFDRYSQGMFTVITAILMLSIVDGLLTLLLIERGASELNPVMAYFLEYGPLSFITAKYVLTSFGVFLLLIFKNVFINPISIYTQSLFTPVIFTFGTVIVWELWLLFATR